MEPDVPKIRLAISYRSADLSGGPFRVPINVISSSYDFHSQRFDVLLRSETEINDLGTPFCASLEDSRLNAEGKAFGVKYTGTPRLVVVWPIAKYLLLRE